MLDTGHGALTGQAGLYVEVSRARDRFVLVTNDRERLEEVLEAIDGSRMTALEAVGGEEDPPPGAPAAALAMLRGLEADWRRLVDRAETQDRELTRMEDYARIVTGAAMLAEGMELPADLQGVCRGGPAPGRAGDCRAEARVRVPAQGRDALPGLAAAEMGGGETRAFARRASGACGLAGRRRGACRDGRAASGGGRQKHRRKDRIRAPASGA